MNAGLSNLATLKTWLLPASLRDGTDYDAIITRIGLGVAAQIEKHCNRRFARVEDDTFEMSGPREHIVVPRYPIEEITKIELRESLSDGWIDQGTVADVVLNISEKAGLVELSARLSLLHSARVRLTYSGGYFFEQLEPDDVGYPTAAPAGSTALEDDLLHAWLLQCEQVWKVKDRLGLAIGESGGGSGSLLGLSLPGLDENPLVAKALQPFVRYVLT